MENLKRILNKVALKCHILIIINQKASAIINLS